MDSVRSHTQTSCKFTLVFDDRWPVVTRLAHIVKLWDRDGVFTLLSRASSDTTYQPLLEALDNCPWSLLLVDDLGSYWSGPEAIPIILKNLPFGKIAAVLYIVPGTMWLTTKLYLWVSRNRQRFA